MTSTLPPFKVEPQGSKCIIRFEHGGVRFNLHAEVPAEQGRFLAPQMVTSALEGERKREIKVARLGEWLGEAARMRELRVSEKTLYGYARGLAHVLEHFGHDPEEVSVTLLNSTEGGYSIPERFERAGGSAHVLRQARAMFSKRALRIYERQGLPASTFSQFVAFTPRAPVVESFETSTEEVDRIIERCARLPEENEEFHKVYLLAFGCGLRSSEILRVRFSDLRELNGAHYLYLEKTKAGKPQKTGIPARVYESLKGYENGDPSAFVVQGANRPKLVQREFVSFLREEAGVEDKKPVHRLRKILGARMASAHGIYAACKTLRHSSVTVTEKYYADLIDHKNNLEV